MFIGLWFADGRVRVPSAPTNHEKYIDKGKDNLFYTERRYQP